MSYPGGYPPHSQGSGQFPQPYQGSTPGYPPAPYPSNPSPYPTNPSPYPSNPSPYPSNPSPYPSNPSPYPSNPSPYPSNPSPYPSNPSPYPSNPSPYPSNPSPYPSPYPSSQPAPYPPAYPPSQQSSYPLAQPSAYPAPAPIQAATFTPSYSSPTPDPRSHQGSNHPHSYQPHGGATGHGQPQQTYNKGIPTVKPAHPFDARHDAEVLRKAMKGFGTDEKSIIQVLTKRTNAQRQEIAAQFKTLYGKDLISNLKSELSGNFEDLIVAMMTPIPEFQAKEINYAISGLGTNEATLVELMCSATNREIHEMRSAYQRLYNSTLEKDLEGDTSGSFRRLMFSLCQGRRSEDYVVNHQAAVMDAQALLTAGELQLGTDESTFNAILVSRSLPQLIQVFMEYQRLTGHGIEEAVKGEFSGNIEDGLLAIIKCVKNKAEFFAERLHDSMAGLGTKDRALIRIITIRSEIDMEDIKRAFSKKYGQSLADFIKDDTSGDYKKCLLGLIV